MNKGYCWYPSYWMTIKFTTTSVASLGYLLGMYTNQQLSACKSTATCQEQEKQQMKFTDSEQKWQDWVRDCGKKNLKRRWLARIFFNFDTIWICNTGKEHNMVSTFGMVCLALFVSFFYYFFFGEKLEA